MTSSGNESIPLTPALACQAVSKCYGTDDARELVLDGVAFACLPGETCALLGPSGSGKTTLLSILGCLLTPTAGRVWVSGEEVDYRKLNQLTMIRRHRIGFVFQQAHLLPFLTVMENLQLVGKNAGLPPIERERRVLQLLTTLGVERYGDRRPDQLSGGQRQRVAIARAVLHHPSVVLADEPTAALDAETGLTAVRLLIEQAKLEGAALVVVTHDTRIVPQFDRTLRIESGRLLA